MVVLALLIDSDRHGGGRRKTKAFDKIVNIELWSGFQFCFPFLSFGLMYVFAYLLKLLPTAALTSACRRFCL